MIATLETTWDVVLRLHREQESVWDVRARLIDEMEARGELDYKLLKRLEDQAMELEGQVQALEPEPEDDWIKGRNLLDPVRFDEFGDAQRFARWHKCATCLSQLLVGASYYITCPSHGPVNLTGVITKKQAEQVQSNTYQGGRELRQLSKKTDEELFRELGF